MKRSKMNVTQPYSSLEIGKTPESIKMLIAGLVKKQFGKRFSRNKLFCDKVNSVAFKLNEDGHAIACAQMDGERLYAVSAVIADEAVALVENLCRNNYNVWTTIAASNRGLITLAEKAGLMVVNDTELIAKILIAHYPTYKGMLETRTVLDHTVFTKKGKEDYPQVLMRS